MAGGFIKVDVNDPESFATIIPDSALLHFGYVGLIPMGM